MAFLSSLDISASGMTAQRLRLDVAAQNIANIETTRTEDGGTYRRKVVRFQAEEDSFQSALRRARNAGRSDERNGGVIVTEIAEDQTDLKMVFNPEHPDADENGYVTYPNVNIITEMTNLIDASRAYEANATAFSASKSIALKGLEMGQS